MDWLKRSNLIDGQIFSIPAQDQRELIY